MPEWSSKHPLVSLEISGNEKCWGPSGFLFGFRKHGYRPTPHLEGGSKKDANGDTLLLPRFRPLRGRLTQRAFLSPCCRFIGGAQSRYCRDRPYAQYLDRELSPVRRSAASPQVAPLCSESQARPAKVTRECSTNTRKNQGASERATATTQAAGADRLRRGQLPQCTPRLTSVRRGAVQPLWRPATGRVLRLWRTERYRWKALNELSLMLC